MILMVSNAFLTSGIVLGYVYLIPLARPTPRPVRTSFRTLNLPSSGIAHPLFASTD